MNPDGTELSRFAAAPSSSTYPTWSPDGKLLAFVVGTQSNERIDVAAAHGGKPPRSVLGCRAAFGTDSCYLGFFGLTWAPDGESLAFATGNSIYVVNRDGSGLRKVAGPLGTIQTPPAWSPDGRTVLASITRGSQPGTGGTTDILAVDPTSGKVRNLTKCSATGPVWCTPMSPSWSPDGNTIAWSGARARVGYGVFLMDANGRHVRALASSGENGNFVGPGFADPTWSPDGTELLFIRGTSTGHGYHLCEVKPDGAGLHKIAAPAGDLLPPISWQPVQRA